MIDIRATRSPVIPANAGIQYAAASRFYRWRSGILGRPVKPGDDRLCTCGDLPVGQFCVESPLQKYFASPVEAGQEWRAFSRAACTIRLMTNRTFKSGESREQPSLFPPRIEDRSEDHTSELQSQFHL